MPKSGSRTILARQRDPAHRVQGRDGAVQGDGLEMDAPHHPPPFWPALGRAGSQPGRGPRGWIGGMILAAGRSHRNALRVASVVDHSRVIRLPLRRRRTNRMRPGRLSCGAARPSRSLCRLRMGGHLMPARYTGMGGLSERCGAPLPRLPWSFPEIKTLD